MKGSSGRIHFVSLGCPKNRVDSEVMLGVASDAGYSLSEDADQADVIVINTCGFIGEAKKESIDTIFEMSELKESGSCKKLIVTGCLSQRYPEELSSQMPEVDHFLGSSDMLKLGDVLKGKADRMLVGNPADWVVRAKDPRVLTGPRASAYVKIAEGCNRTCAFCTIPEFRGKQRSRPISDIVREVRHLVEQGVKEVNLISQDTLSFGRDREDDANLIKLVERVAQVDGLHWLRLFYLYPENLSDDLLRLMREHPRIVKYVDMPLQHAADAMLKRMRRGHGKERQKRVVTRLREAIPDLTFRTAFIVGHPGETDAEFEELCEFVTWANFEKVGVFRYSDEESARSHALDGKVPANVASRRYRKLMGLARKLSRAHQKRLLGRELEVLVEGQSEEHEFVVQGRHAGQAPEIDGHVFLSGDEALPGQLRRVVIEQAADYDVVGTLLPLDGAAQAPRKPRSRATEPNGEGPRDKPRVRLRVVAAG
jgi:ribosomal protein S12 methylthiotransferase